MKQRFSSLDVRVIAGELNASLTTLRVSNVYDLSSRIFLFKFAKPGKREQLLVDSGFRCHLTSFTRTAASAPSAFVTRLRKYLKSRRVTSVSQIGTDRVIEIAFSDGQYKLFLEFFAAGNIILTDAELNVLALLRQVNEGDERVDVSVGVKYQLEPKQNYHGIPDVTEERARATLEKAHERVKAANEVGGKKAKRAKGGDDLRKALSAGFPEYPPHLLESVFKSASVDVGWKIRDVLGSQENMNRVMRALEDASDVFKSLDGGLAKGYIIATNKDKSGESATHEDAAPSRDSILYDDFHPFRPFQLENKPGTHIFEYDGFNRTVDEFYSSIESQKLESRLTEHEEAAKRKLQKAKDEHEKRLGALQHVQELHIRKAQAIEANNHRVEEACAAVNGLIGQGMDWIDIGKLIENEKGRGNVVAQMVKGLKLEENAVTLLLDEPGAEYDDDDSDEEDRTDDEAESADEDTTQKDRSTDKRLAIDIDLSLSPWANARQYYDQKKQASVKEQKTMQASARALKSTEKKIQDDLKRGLKQEKEVMRPTRKQFWFEKFLWFISSDGYLVLGGKDAQQNELLYRRYLKKGDIYVHADLQGASSVIVKNNPSTPDAPIPPSTLSQAGALTVCTSNAWDSKAVMAAWWVNADQVSKTAPTGEYLTTGGFVVRGKKNFLPPAQLLLGFGVVWLISEGSRANHGKHRLVKTESMVEGDSEVLAADAKGLSIEEAPAGLSADLIGEAYDVGDTVPDVEDAADDPQQELTEDEEAGAGVHEDEELEDAGEKDEKASTAASDAEEDRSNPLQSMGVKVDTTDEQVDSPTHDEDDHASASENEQSDHEEQSSTTQSTRPATPSSHFSVQAKQKPFARGKRTKAKRAAQKYADQDDQDRALAMALLGSNRASEQKQAQEEDKAVRLAKLEADKERRRKQHEKDAEREKERMARLERGEVVQGEEGDVEQLALERQEHANIDLLVLAPEAGDELVAAVPVIAPWGALGRCKYKVKLQPGGQKKGKAVREIVGAWITLAGKGRKVVDEEGRDKERVWPREVELIKAWKVEEVVGSLPVKGVRVVQGGGLGGTSGGGGGGGAGGGGKGKGAGGGSRGGKGSKKAR